MVTSLTFGDYAFLAGQSRQNAKGADFGRFRH